MVSRLSFIGFYLFVIFASAQGKAAEKTFSVFDIRKTTQMHSHQKVYRDYYVNMGTDQGVKAGSILAVYRRQPVYDYYHEVLHDDLLVPVAHMKVVMAQNDTCVARIESLTPARQIPVVEFNTVMLGDRVEQVKENNAPRAKRRRHQNVAVAIRN